MGILTDNHSKVRGARFGNLDEVLRWLLIIHPVVTPRGWVEKGNLIIKMVMLKIGNGNAHNFGAPPVCQGPS